MHPLPPFLSIPIATTLALAAATPAQERAAAVAQTGFRITHEKGQHIDICHRGRPVLRLMVGNDTSDPKRADATYKVYAHVMDPLDPEGRRRLTKGPGDKFPHHRGIFVGWSKASVAGVGNVDTWHMKQGVRQHFARIVTEKADPRSATLSVAIDWVKGDRPLLDEVRTFVVHEPRSDGGVLIDVASAITASAGKTVLKGDPEHAGVQFRAHEAVVKNKSARYLFPAAMRPGNKGDRDMPWAAMSFAIEDRSYLVQHMSHPSLPKGNVYSAYRDYGRFGAYFARELAKGESATFRVRLYVGPGGLAEGDAAGEQLAAMQQRYQEYVQSVR